MDSRLNQAGIFPQLGDSPRRRQQMKSCDNCRRRKVRCDSVDKSPCSYCLKVDRECSFTRQWKRPGRRYPGIVAASQAPPETSSSIVPDETHKSHSPSSASWDIGSITNSAVISQGMARNSLNQFFLHGVGAENWEVFEHSDTMRLAYVGTNVSNLSHLINLEPQKQSGQQSARPLHLPHPRTHPLTPWKPGLEQTLFSLQFQGTNLDPFRDLSFFPAKDIRDSLVDAYFDKINPYFPVIDEFDFRRRYEDPSNPPPLIVLQSVILVGAHVCSHPKIAESRAVVTAMLFFRAKALFDMRHENNRLHLIQCALLFTWYLENADSAGANSYYWAGVACRIAFGIGMHRDLSPHLRPCMMPLGERRAYRRVWWTLFQTEIFTALEHGRPSMILLEDLDQPPLELDDFKEENGVLNQKLNFNYCQGNIELCYMILEILRLNKPRASGLQADTGTILASLDSRLVDWILTNPASNEFWSLQLQMHYQTVIIHLHRKFIPMDSAWNGSVSLQPPQQQSESTEICNRAAGAIISIFETMLSMGCLDQCPFTAIIALTAAAIHTSREIRLAIETGATLLALNTQNYLERLFAPSKELSLHWPNAEAVLELFQTLHERFRNKIMSILRSNAAPGILAEQISQESRTEPGVEECQGEDGRQEPDSYGRSGYTPDASALMNALDWQDIMFYHVT